ncbi:MAG TPA: agmatine deiminase family protein [Chloroflexi bacterium]|nr:agmatine deiminase family protein [Chloroflexota bacterium]
MNSRRLFLKKIGVLIAFSLVGCNRSANLTSSTTSTGNWFMPDESAVHKRTWMSFRASEEIWGRKLASGAQDNLATIARTIARYEPVVMLVEDEDYDTAQKKCGPSVELLKTSIDDLWMRDTGAVFVQNQGGALGAVDFNFNGWGDKQEHENDAKIAGFIARYAQAELLNTQLALEGGGIEVDGRGTAIITESCTLNPNRNPDVSKQDCEAELNKLLGLRKIIWLPGTRGQDITDGHTDFYARFVRPGMVAAHLENDPQFYDYEVTRTHLEMLRSATDAEGRKLEVVVLEGPQSIRPEYASNDFAAGYINFYVANGVVVAPEFGDIEADSKAKETLERLFPKRDIVQINIDAIAAGGGGIHCTTQQEPV